jgi:hypothetical protein
MKKQTLDQFVLSYMECALWSSTNEFGNPLDHDYNYQNLTPEAMEQMIAECELFQFLASPYLDLAFTDYNGHDFWLTRNHHGSGFWDHDYYGEIASKKLTTISHSFGECDLYVTEDNHIAIG